MKSFRMGYGLLVLMLMSLFSKDVNLYANINSGKDVMLGVGDSPEILTKAGYLARVSAEHVQENIVAGNYLEIVFGAIAICVFLLFTMELIDENNKEKKN